MPLWRLRSTKSEEENNVTLESAPQLQQYEIDLDPPLPLSVRIKQTTVGAVESISRSIAVQKTVIALSIDLVCLVYQTVDLYKNVYPGSKIAANILRNNHTVTAWTIYFWVLAAGATVANIFAAKEWLTWFIAVFRVDFWVTRIFRYSFLILTFYLVFYLIIVPTLLVGPMWIAFAVRYAWGTIAWKHGCPGWDYTIIFDVEYDVYTSSDLSWLGIVSITGPHSSYAMALSQFTSSPNEYLFNVTATSNIVPAFSLVWYNMTELTYTIADSPIPFIIKPNLVLPALHVSQRDPSIPFLRNDVRGYPPSADLVYTNGTRVLKTVTQNYPALSKLLACGMENHSGALQIALGVVAIEQWNSLNDTNNLQ